MIRQDINLTGGGNTKSEWEETDLSWTIRVSMFDINAKAPPNGGALFSS